jgi:hypothetical protein
LTSDNGAYEVILQDDGNLVLYAGEQSVWSTGTNGQSVVRAEVQEDGDFVLYTADKPVWHSDTKGAKDVRLVLQDDRNLVLYGSTDRPGHPRPTRTKRHHRHPRRPNPKWSSRRPRSLHRLPRQRPHRRRHRHHLQ